MAGAARCNTQDKSNFEQATSVHVMVLSTCPAQVTLKVASPHLHAGNGDHKEARRRKFSRRFLRILHTPSAKVSRILCSRTCTFFYLSPGTSTASKDGNINAALAAEKNTTGT
jgi:hypothetical protein